jgi:hypothetical protein
MYGYHALVCRGHLLPRHNLVRDALHELLVKARFHPVKDAPVTCLGKRSGQPTLLRPADLLISGDDYDRDCVDVTVVSPLVSGNQPEVVVGKMAAEAERRKGIKHLAACEQAGLGFKAFAMDVFGVMAPDALVLMNRIIHRLIRECDYPKYMASSICYRRVSMALQMGVARQFLASRPVVV